MLTTNNTAADIHFVHALTVLRKLPLTSNIMDTSMSLKDMKFLITRRVEQGLWSFNGFNGNNQNLNNKNDNRQKTDTKGTKRRVTEKYLAKLIARRPNRFSTILVKKGPCKVIQFSSALIIILRIR